MRDRGARLDGAAAVRRWGEAFQGELSEFHVELQLILDTTVHARSRVFRGLSVVEVRVERGGWIISGQGFARSPPSGPLASLRRRFCNALTTRRPAPRRATRWTQLISTATIARASGRICMSSVSGTAPRCGAAAAWLSKAL